MKKGLLLLTAILVVFGLVACKETTTTAPVTTGQTTTAFAITLSGLTDVGFTEDDRVYTDQVFDLLAGVTAIGTDGVDYKTSILVQSDQAACDVDEENFTLVAASAGVCTITYSVVIQGKLARGTRSIKVIEAPSTLTFTETELLTDANLFATEGTIPDLNNGTGAAYAWEYWVANADVLGTTGFAKVEGGKLIIKQEGLGGVGYGMQTICLTDVPMEPGRTYKITMTITSDVDRVIDFVTKAPNSDYAHDTHSYIEIKAGTDEYEAVFVAFNEVLYINILTGTVQDQTNVGTLEFSNFTFWEGPIVIDYVEVADFFANADIPAGTAIEYITGTDTDYVREFYYWDEGTGALMTGETVEGGVSVTVVTAASNTWGIQLQWNDINKAGTPLIKDAAYKLTMNVNASVARSMTVEITGKVNGLPASGSKSYELSVGDNALELEFTSLYDYFFVKVHFGNYGDATQTGTFVITDLHLFVDSTATPPEPEEEVLVDHVDRWEEGYVAVENGIQNGDFEKADMVIDVDGTDGWTFWTTVDQTWASTQIDATFAIVDGELVVTTLGTGGEVWYIQLSYRPNDEDLNVIPGATYKIEFDVNASVGGTFSMEMTTTGNAANVAIPVTLEAGDNHVVVEYVAYEENFKLTACLGLYGLATLTFDNFTMSEYQIIGVADIDGGIQNGDFEKADMVIDVDGTDGWTYWTTVDQTWASVQIDATFEIVEGELVVTTLGTGGEVWYIQMSYRPNDADLNVVAGHSYRVEFDVNASVGGTFSMEMTTTGNAGNVAIPVTLEAGDNHVVVEYVAYEENFKLTACLGLYGLATLTFDNFTIAEIYQFDAAAIDGGIQNGDFSKEGMVIDVDGTDGWTYWTTVDQSWASVQIDATFEIVDEALQVTTLGTGGEVWYIQMSYRPNADLDVIPGHVYQVEFDVVATVAGTFSMEMTTTGNAGNVAIPVTLVVGENHVVVRYIAFEANFKLTACLGLYGLATLTFDNFTLTELVVR